MWRRTCMVVATVSGIVCAASVWAQPGNSPEKDGTYAGAPDATGQLTWPRTIDAAGTKILVYQPQLEKWVDDRLEGRAAVAVTPAGGKEATYGVIWLTARTEVDKSNRLVTLDNLKITRASFPQAKDRAESYLQAIRQHAAGAIRVVPLDHLEANLAIVKATHEANAVPVKNTPPQIVISRVPTLLVLIDGEPVLRPIEGGKLMRVVNTRALIVLDETAKRYYLHAMTKWLTANDLIGPWSPAETVSVELEALKEKLAKAGTIDPLDPADPTKAPKNLPVIHVSTEPAELIQLQGPPEYTPIQGTELLYVRNTDAALFMALDPQRYYVLISGRWFAAPALDEPWAYVSAKELPPEFAKIPPDGPKANVLVSVPGTDQAKEAVIANSIPQTATVSIADTHLTVAYDGEPKLKKIDGAEGLSYVVNTGLPVIRIDTEKTFWCVQNGVWFHAQAPTGPWVVATGVPGIIYTIPVTSPLHYVTYVRVYGATDKVVYVGYTPGYMGTCVSSDGVVVYGTGYVYPAYVGTVWVGYPPTYGYGAGFACGAVTGFAFGFAAGAILGDCWPRPYWGPCWGYAHVDINTTSVYRNWRGGVTHTNRHYDFDSWTGESHAWGGGATFNPYSGRASVGGYARELDRGDGDFAVKGGGATYDPRTGVIRGGGGRAEGNIYDGDLDIDTNRFRYDTRADTGIARHGDDVYAGHDGDVFRHTDDGWQKHTDDGWEDAERPTVDRLQIDRSQRDFSQQRQQLDSQRRAREIGQRRFEGFGSGGGFHERRGGGFGGGGLGGGRPRGGRR